MMKIRFLMTTMLVLITLVSYSQSRENRGDMEEKLKSQKIAFITSSLDLSAEESEKFWPIYNDFHKKIEVLKGDSRKDGKKHADMSEGEAKTLVMQRLDFEEKGLSLKRGFISDVSKVISMKKVAKLQTVEREFRKKMFSKIKDGYKKRSKDKNERSKKE